MAKKKKKQDIFVAVQNPTYIRQLLLEVTKKILQSRKVFEEIKAIRSAKLEEKKLVRKQIKEI